MMARGHKSFATLLLLGIGLGWVAPACASLGGNAASVVADTEAMHGALRTTRLEHYVLEEIATDTGMRIAEYLRNDGVVFAVAWSGPVAPDMSLLLGASFAPYAKAAAALTHPGLHRSLRIAAPDLIVEIGGELRGYRGRALLPMLIPAGTEQAELR